MTLPGGKTGLRLPAPRQAHSPSQHAGTYGHCSNSAVISPPDICARPGLSCWNGVFTIACQPGPGCGRMR